ncbi:MAG: hypothetical protein BUE48_006175 [Thermomonospora sp. CIF 1]|nr:MAG: hypothetical protein BUE48_006175 [Thermomonospora sp. CIF 1]
MRTPIGTSSGALEVGEGEGVSPGSSGAGLCGAEGVGEGVAGGLGGAVGVALSEGLGVGEGVAGGLGDAVGVAFPVGVGEAEASAHRGTAAPIVSTAAVPSPAQIGPHTDLTTPPYLRGTALTLPFPPGLATTCPLPLLEEQKSCDHSCDE